MPINFMSLLNLKVYYHFRGLHASLPMKICKVIMIIHAWRDFFIDAGDFTCLAGELEYPGGRLPLNVGELAALIHSCAKHANIRSLPL